MTSKLIQSLAKGAKKFSIIGLAAPALLLLGPNRAEAILNYYIFEEGGNLKIVTQGSLKLSGLGSHTGAVCGDPVPPGGALVPGFAIICSGREETSSDAYKKYVVDGPTAFMPGTGNVFNASNTSGTRNWLWGDEGPDPSFYIIDPYTDDSPINSSATFNGLTLADFSLDGLTANANIGTWTFLSDTNPNNVINVIVGSPPAQPVPAPLPLIGAAGAYGWSRRLRRRVGSGNNR